MTPEFKLFYAIVVTVSMKGNGHYKIQFVDSSCRKERAMALAEDITKKANGRAISAECIPILRK